MIFRKNINYTIEELKSKSIHINNLITLDTMMNQNKEMTDKFIQRIEKEISNPRYMKHLINIPIMKTKK